MFFTHWQCVQTSLQSCLSSSTVTCFEPWTEADLQNEWKGLISRGVISPCGNVMNLQSYYDFVNTTAPCAQAHTHRRTKQGESIPYSGNVWVIQALGCVLSADLYQTGNICPEYKRREGSHLSVTTKGWSKAGPQLMGHMVLYVQPRREQVDSNGRATHAQNVYYPKKLNYRQSAWMLYVAPTLWCKRF